MVAVGVFSQAVYIDAVSFAVLHKAESNLDDDQKSVEKQLEEYRNSLITYAYETELIKQKLDTVVSEDEIAAFYKNNQNKW